MGYLGNQITTVFPTSISVDSATISGNASIGGTLGVTGVSTLSDNIVFDASSKGVHLGVTSATASNLLDDYEEGTWTPTDASGAGLTFPTINQKDYTRVGRLVTIGLEMFFPTTSDTNNALITLPFPVAARGGHSCFSNRAGIVYLYTAAGTSNIYLYTETGSALTNANMSGKYIISNASYMTT